jgi:hypothetical protein
MLVLEILYHVLNIVYKLIFLISYLLENENNFTVARNSDPFSIL